MATTKAPARAIPTSSPMFVLVDVDMVVTGVEVGLPCTSPIATTTGVIDCRAADGLAVEVRNVLAAAGEDSCICDAANAGVGRTSEGVGEDCCI